MGPPGREPSTCKGPEVRQVCSTPRNNTHGPLRRRRKALSEIICYLVFLRTLSCVHTYPPHVTTVGPHQELIEIPGHWRRPPGASRAVATMIPTVRLHTAAESGSARANPGVEPLAPVLLQLLPSILQRQRGPCCRTPVCGRNTWQRVDNIPHMLTWRHSAEW